jgi:hydrogenase nickel incorporation protein HypA/HybF
MHELSIAMSIVETAMEEAERRGARVEAVHLKVGLLSGVVADALLFSYEVACQDTPLQGSRLVIEEVPIVVYCSTCDAQRTLESMQLFCCPACGTPTGEVVHGKELQVVALEIIDESGTAVGGSSKKYSEAE